MAVKIIGAQGGEFGREFMETLGSIEKELLTIVSDEVARMELRITREHRDVNNQGFKPYSESYSRAKGRYQHPGSKTATVPRDAVDMTLTGAMLRAITRSIKRMGNRIEATVYFSSAKEAAKARGNFERGRDFFGFTKEQWANIREKIAELIKE